jgi:hypothetical protein
MTATTHKYRVAARLALGALAMALLAPCTSVQAAERNIDARRDSARSANESGIQVQQKKKQLRAATKKKAPPLTPNQ